MASLTDRAVKDMIRRYRQAPKAIQKKLRRKIRWRFLRSAKGIITIIAALAFGSWIVFGPLAGSMCLTLLVLALFEYLFVQMFVNEAVDEQIARYLLETTEDGRFKNCLVCGYDLRGTSSNDCPECGGQCLI